MIDWKQVAIEEEAYKPDLELLDRYVGFSSELVRVSLLGLAAIGFYLKEFVANAQRPDSPPGWFSLSIAIAALTFGAAIAFGLLHRYYASDGLYYHFKSLRLRPSENNEGDTAASIAEGRNRNRRYGLSGRWLVSCECAVVAGAAIVATSFIVRFSVNGPCASSVIVGAVVLILLATVGTATPGWIRFFKQTAASRTQDSARS